ncbi:hypothetical protein Taro_050818 [Colocasia esculenta]|uniref:Uncharacterized protein n=1 Tax=Colocasia esculenta TaxID=4460 RepID=A0A843XED4_COLES|nr:hypothetical protein [Colocasia esculenta]
MGKTKKKENVSSHQGSLEISHDIHSTVFPYFARWRESYGKVFVYWLGTEPFLYVAEPEFLKQATSGVLGKRWGKPDVFRHDRKPMFGEGLVMSEGDTWAQHRQIISPAFSATNLNAMLNSMAESTSSMIEEWGRLLTSGHHEIDVEDHIVRNASEIIGKTSFGISHEMGKEVFNKLRDLQVLLFKSKRLVGVPFNKLLHLRQTRAASALGKEIDEILLSIIESRKASVVSREAETFGPQEDLLGLLLEGNQRNDGGKNKKLTERELVDECKTFFFGGHETTALALTWTLLLLATNPEWQTILRQEVEEVIGGRPVDSALLTKLTKMQWVLNEALRLYAPAPNLHRQAREDIRVGEVVIPKGTNMWVDVVGLHHDPALWGDDVNEFKPERFEDSPYGGCKHRMGFLPFGFGGRICVGRNLTMFEYKIVLIQILRRFSVSVSPKYVHAPTHMLSLRPAHGVPLVLTPV